LLGGALMLTGGVLVLKLLVTWIGHGFGALAQDNVAVVAGTLMILGVQVFFTSFLVSILGQRRGS
jgi:hypothetical protein